MKVKVFRKKRRSSIRMNSSKKFLALFCASLFLCVSASLVGVFFANNATATRPAKYPYTQFDRIIYNAAWEAKGHGRCTDSTSNIGLRNAVCWDAIPQKYALGFITSNRNVERSYRSITVNKNGVAANTTPQQATFFSKGNPTISGVKSPLRFADFYDGASYMGDLYDLRVRIWTASGSAGVNLGYAWRQFAPITHVNTPGGSVVSEYHFYPRGTLKALDELYFDRTAGLVECDKTTMTCDQCTTTKVKDPVTGKEVPVETCTYDEYAYRDDDGKIIYTGSYRDGKDGPIVYTAKTMEEYLLSQERSVTVLGQEEPGFYGTTAFYDIDSWGMERYVPARGVEAVYTTWNSWQYARRETINNDSYKELCPDADPSKICYYAWGGIDENNPGDLTSWQWYPFKSTAEAPFALMYIGYGHGSGLSTSTFTIAHVLKDDLMEIPDEVLIESQNFRANYEKIYGHPLEEDEFFESHPDVDPDQVLRLFRVYQYADYDPYTINDLLEELGGYGLLWYNCEDTNDSCEIPRDPQHDQGEQIMGNGTVIYNGYDFVNGDRIYYSSIDYQLEVEFDNTCYSDNTSVKKVSQDE